MATDITALIRNWQDGDQQALERLTPFVYDELRRLAGLHMRRERAQVTLQATALVNEAFVRLSGSELQYEDSTHFYNTAARIMRHVLVDHARSRTRAKRGGAAARLTFDEAAHVGEDNLADILELDIALDRLAEHEPRLASAIELLFFGGLTYDEAAKQLGVSRTTFYEDLQFAKAWLKRELC